MIHIPRWKILLTITVSLLSILYCVPTLLDKSSQQWLKSNLPSWLPTHSVRLGLDLQGGSHLLLEADIDAVVRQRVEDMITSLRTDLSQRAFVYSFSG